MLAAWAPYVVFLVCAFAFEWHDRIFAFDGPFAPAKALVWIAWAGFLVYSLYCSSRESLFRSIKKIGELHWGRQIGTDLYLGLLLALLVVYLNDGWVAALLWAIPTLPFANLAILLYFAIHFDELVAKFSA